MFSVYASDKYLLSGNYYTLVQAIVIPFFIKLEYDWKILFPAFPFF